MNADYYLSRVWSCSKWIFVSSPIIIIISSYLFLFAPNETFPFSSQFHLECFDSSTAFAACVRCARLMWESFFCRIWKSNSAKEVKALKYGKYFCAELLFKWRTCHTCSVLCVCACIVHRCGANARRRQLKSIISPEIDLQNAMHNKKNKHETVVLWQVSKSPSMYNTCRFPPQTIP